MLLGQVLVDVGRTSEASEHYLDALSIAEANDFRLLQAEILARLGTIRVTDPRGSPTSKDPFLYSKT